MGKRLGKFGLELSAEKTRVVSFSPNENPGKNSFDFLGFEFRWSKDLKEKAQSTSEEPGAAIPHAGIHTGTVGKLAVLSWYIRRIFLPIDFAFDTTRMVILI